MPHVHTHDDLGALSAAAAARVAEMIEATPPEDTFTLVLAGGSTPRTLYERLATEHADLPWDRVCLFMGDERFVPPTDEHSNYHTARQALIDRIAIPEINVYPIPTELDDPGDAARVYATTLRSTFGKGVPTFDLVLLGMGADGHTVSLFPGSRALKVTSRTVTTSKAPASMPVRDRITLTLPVLNAAKHVFFLVAGADKRETLAAVLDGHADAAERYPAARVDGADVHWYVDRAAAGSSG